MSFIFVRVVCGERPFLLAQLDDTMKTLCQVEEGHRVVEVNFVDDTIQVVDTEMDILDALVEFPETDMVVVFFKTADEAGLDARVALLQYLILFLNRLIYIV